MILKVLFKFPIFIIILNTILKHNVFHPDITAMVDWAQNSCLLSSIFKTDEQRYPHLV